MEFKKENFIEYEITFLDFVSKLFIPKDSNSKLCWLITKCYLRPRDTLKLEGYFPDKINGGIYSVITENFGFCKIKKQGLCELLKLKGF